MSLVPQGSGRLLAMMLGKVAMEDMVLRLYVNNKTPAHADVASDYTEASGNGYGPPLLARADWTVANGVPDVATQPQMTFTCGAGGGWGTVYGYFITGASSGLLLWAERFANPIVTAANDQIALTARIELS